MYQTMISNSNYTHFLKHFLVENC